MWRNRELLRVDRGSSYLSCVGAFASSHLSPLVPEELASVLYDLFVRQQAVGLLLAQSEDLPQGDPERPDVTGCGELTLRRSVQG